MMGALTKALECLTSCRFAYLMYHDVCERIAAMAAERGIPVVVGGPAFHGAETRRATG
ncbi:MAG: hypothetical protein R3E96_02770 [Planctomycetota bacterium]